MVIRSKKGDLEWNTLIPWIIAIFILVLVAVLYFILSGKGLNMAEYIKNLVRFG